MAHARARAPDQIQSGSDQSLHAASYPYPGLLEESELYCKRRAGRGPANEDKPIHPRLERRERKKLG